MEFIIVASTRLIKTASSIFKIYAEITNITIAAAAEIRFAYSI